MWFFQKFSLHRKLSFFDYLIGISILGATLKGANSVVTWNPQEKEDEEYPDRANKLILKQILLDVAAKADEYNVVEVSNVYFNL
jgi:Nucleoplasmin/nucleophosmin domain